MAHHRGFLSFQFDPCLQKQVYAEIDRPEEGHYLCNSATKFDAPGL
jgi:hypothetical protein